MKESMSVHLEISKHSSKQNAIVTEFVKLEQKRERLIDEAVAQCVNGQHFTVSEINEVSKQMNILSQKGIVPQRKLVTEEMVKEYVDKRKKG